jgi:hypothetical protein
MAATDQHKCIITFLWIGPVLTDLSLEGKLKYVTSPYLKGLIQLKKKPTGQMLECPM